MPRGRGGGRTRCGDCLGGDDFETAFARRVASGVSQLHGATSRRRRGPLVRAEEDPQAAVARGAALLAADPSLLVY